MVTALTPFCVANYMKQPDAAQKLAVLRADSSSYTQREIIEKAGFATMPGKTEPSSGLAAACATALRSTGISNADGQRANVAVEANTADEVIRLHLGTRVFRGSPGPPPVDGRGRRSPRWWRATGLDDPIRNDLAEDHGLSRWPHHEAHRDDASRDTEHAGRGAWCSYSPTPGWARSKRSLGTPSARVETPIVMLGKRRGRDILFTVRAERLRRGARSAQAGVLPKVGGP